MAISIASQPAVWSSCYRPMVFEAQSDLFPNTTTGETAIPIGNLINSAGAVRLNILSPFATTPLSPGDTVSITGTALGEYVGTWRVLAVADIGGGLQSVTIDAEYTVDDSGGFISREYPDMRIVARIDFPAFARTVEVEMRPDENNVFTLNVEDICARQFESLFDHIAPNGPLGLAGSGDKCIATGYDVTLSERYTAWIAGVPLTVDVKGSEERLRGFRAVNMVHPYHKSDPFALDWSSDIGSVFPMGSATGASGARRLLTWGSRTEQLAEAGDDFFVSVLCNTETENAWRIVAVAYVGGLPTLSVQAALITSLPRYAATFNVGPAQLPGLLAGADAYEVTIYDRNNVAISEPLMLKYVPCVQSEVKRRVYWRGKLGGIDQFTMRGRETERPEASRQSVGRLSDPLPSASGARYLGGWMERGNAVAPVRSKTLTSAHVSADEIRWLSEDCFESPQHALQIRNKWWTPMAIESTNGVAYGTDNVAKRFTLDYHLGVDNRSQRE